MKRSGGVPLGLRCAVLGAAATLAACVDPDPYGDGYHYFPDPSPDEVAELNIDAGEALALDPGAGVGVGVSYAGDGRWALTTVCDTTTSDLACLFDVLIASDGSAAGIGEPMGTDLESDDSVSSPDPFALQLDFLTEGDVDGVTFSVSPGATVRISALLYDPVEDFAFDWSDDPRFISWVGSGAIHRGAPTNPVDLTPNRP